MSKKRFSTYKNDHTLIDNLTGHICEFPNQKYAETCCKWLNELWEDNKFLYVQKCECESLKEDNRELQEQVQILKKEVRDFLHLCDVCDIQSHLSDECEEVLNDE